MGECSRLESKVRGFDWNIITIEPLILLYAFSYGFKGVASGAMLYRKVCLNIYDDYICNNITAEPNKDQLEDVQKQTSEWIFYMTVSYSIPTLFVIAVYGSWSDRISRKIPMLIVTIGTCVTSVCDLMNAIYIDASPGYAIIGNVIYGLTGGYSVLIVAVFSYLGEVTNDTNRTYRMSLVQASQTIAFFISECTSGVAVDNIGFVFVYSFVLIIHAITILYTVLRIQDIKPKDRESVSPPDEIGAENLGQMGFHENRDNMKHEDDGLKMASVDSNGNIHNEVGDNENADSIHHGTDDPLQLNIFERPDNIALTTNTNTGGRHTETQHDTNPQVPFSQLTWKRKMVELFTLRHFLDSFKVTFKPRQGEIRKCIVLITLILFTVLVTLPSVIFYLFIMHPPLSFSQSLYGYYMGYASLVYFTSQAVTVPIVKKHFHLSDHLMLCVAIGSDVLFRAWLAFCTHNWMVFLGPLFGYMWPNSLIFIRGLVGTMVPADELGQIYSVIGWLDCVAALIASMLFNGFLYPATVEIWPGFVMFISAIGCIIPFVLSIWLFVVIRRTTGRAILENEPTTSPTSTLSSTDQANDLIEKIQNADMAKN